MLSFTAEVFFSLLGQYNRDIWPAPLAGLLLGLGALAVACRPVPGGGRVVAAVLATAWLWTGIVFLGGYLATISFAAPVVAACFVGQAVLLLWRGVARGRLRFRFRRDVAGWSGLVVALAGLALYPLLGLMAGRDWTQLAVFGAAGMTDIHEMNSLKAMLATLINGAAAIMFVVAQSVAWQGCFLAIAAAIGGFVASRVALRAKPEWVRRFALTVAVVVTIYYFAAPATAADASGR